MVISCLFRPNPPTKIHLIINHFIRASVHGSREVRMGKENEGMDCGETETKRERGRQTCYDSEAWNLT